jgi:hypothetical protein
MEAHFSWLELKGRKFIFPCFFFTALIGVLTYFLPMIAPMLDQMGIAISVNYFGLDLQIIDFLFAALYIGMSLGFLKVLNGAIGEFIRFGVWIVYLYYFLVPFATIILTVSIPGMAEVDLDIGVLYVVIFLYGIVVINQVFKGIILYQKFKERDNESIAYSEEREEKSTMQTVLGYLLLAFFVIWILNFFGFFAILTLPQLYDFSSINLMDIDFGLLNVILNRVIWVIGICIIYIILKKIFKPKD